MSSRPKKLPKPECPQCGSKNMKPLPIVDLSTRFECRECGYRLSLSFSSMMTQLHGKDWNK
jgi:transposase-like protein